MMSPLPIEDFQDVFLALARTKAVIVGGQAIYLISTIHEKNKEPWKLAKPYTSYDTDAIASATDVLKVTEFLESKGYSIKITLPTLEEHKAINVALVEAESKGKSLFVNFLKEIKGLGTQEIIESKYPLQWGKTSLNVLHPLHCLESKTVNLLTLPQQDRQDKKHLILAIANLEQFLAKRISPDLKASNIRLAERIIANAFHDYGVDLKNHHQIDTLDAIPWNQWKSIPHLKTFALREDKIRSEFFDHCGRGMEIKRWIQSLNPKPTRKFKR